MEFPETGKQCGLELCKKLDFLPIKCYSCSIVFCNEHNLPHMHNCSVGLDEQSADLSSKVKLKEYRYSCTFGGCKKWELAPVHCSICNQLLCLQHKHQIDHNCPKYVPPSNKMAAAAAKIEELTAQLPSSKVRKIKKNDKLAAKVQLMKLKASALGSKQLPLEERVFFLVYLPKSVKGSAPVFVSHHWSVGKAVDAIADLTKVKNNNNKSTVDRLSLFHSSDGSVLGPFDILIKELCEKELLLNGENLILEYSPKDSLALEDYENYSNS